MVTINVPWVKSSNYSIMTRIIRGELHYIDWKLKDKQQEGITGVDLDLGLLYDKSPL